ncbi:hypothetical protein DL96DRAFT_1048243 [Flagelloscypha sp. PMI_526]|nr:hypothetical protein DL96DRAFT_1048243 [Flagelloscypha sp. PMI_526]
MYARGRHQLGLQGRGGAAPQPSRTPFPTSAMHGRQPCSLPHHPQPPMLVDATAVLQALGPSLDSIQQEVRSLRTDLVAFQQQNISKQDFTNLVKACQGLSRAGVSQETLASLSEQLKEVVHGTAEIQERFNEFEIPVEARGRVIHREMCTSPIKAPPVREVAVSPIRVGQSSSIDPIFATSNLSRNMSLSFASGSTLLDEDPMSCPPKDSRTQATCFSTGTSPLMGASPLPLAPRR